MGLIGHNWSDNDEPQYEGLFSKWKDQPAPVTHINTTTMNNPQWTKVNDSLPTEDKKINWISPDGTQVSGGFRKGNLWFHQGTYVYYTPLSWQYA